jgi:hypothetical protein
MSYSIEDYVDRFRYFGYTRCTLFGVVAFSLFVSGLIDLVFQSYFIQSFSQLFKAEAGFYPTVPIWVDPLHFIVGIPTYSTLVLILSLVLIVKWTRLRKISEGKWTDMYVGVIPYLGLIGVCIAVIFCSFFGALWLTAYPWAHLAR